MTDETPAPAFDPDEFMSRYRAFQARAAELHAANKATVLAVLRDADISKVTVTFNGYGDSSQIDGIVVKAGDADTERPNNSVEISRASLDSEAPETLSEPLADAIETLMAPQPVANWAGVRDAVQFGDRAPQGRTAPEPRPAGEGYSPKYSEDCCVLNVYTPRTDANARLPVMVYIHGGGFRGGSSDGPSVDGSRLAKFGDTVVVTVNRRLNVLGFASLGHLNSRFCDSANAGQLDLIAALRWIKTNIHVFGGDPNRVTLFGVSGGGSSIETLKIMPEASNLFHRSINMSGSSAFAMKTETDMEPVTAMFLKILGIDKTQLDRLQEIPPERLLEAHDAAFRATGGGDFRPVVDGRHIFHGPMTPGGLALSSRLPSIMSCTATEAALWLANDPGNVAITADQLQRRISDQFGLNGKDSAAAIAAYREADPRRTPWEILVALSSNAFVTTPLRRAAEAKAAMRNAPVYFTEFAWKSPKDGGLWGAPHAIDVPFAFGNIDKSNLIPADDPTAIATRDNEMATYVAFARSGTPDNSRIPHWSPYDAQSRPTMVINQTCALVNDYRRSDRLAGALIPQQDAFRIVEGPLFRSSPDTQCSSGGCWH